MTNLLIKQFAALSCNKLTFLSARLGPTQQLAGLKRDMKDKLESLKLPDKPKRPLNPYIRFVAENRGEVAKKNPGLTAREVMQLCAKSWNELEDSQKTEYKKELLSEQDAYEKKRDSYLASLSEEQKVALKKLEEVKSSSRKRRKLRKIYKETDKPKRPIQPFMMYLLEYKNQHKIELKDAMAEIKGKWMNLPETEKMRYQSQYDKALSKYNKEMEAWEKRLIEAGHEDLVKKPVPPKKSRILAGKNEEKAE